MQHFLSICVIFVKSKFGYIDVASCNDQVLEQSEQNPALKSTVNQLIFATVLFSRGRTICENKSTRNCPYSFIVHSQVLLSMKLNCRESVIEDKIAKINSLENKLIYSIHALC